MSVLYYKSVKNIPFINNTYTLKYTASFELVVRFPIYTIKGIKKKEFTRSAVCERGVQTLSSPVLLLQTHHSHVLKVRLKMCNTTPQNGLFAFTLRGLCQLHVFFGMPKSSSLCSHRFQVKIADGI